MVISVRPEERSFETEKLPVPPSTLPKTSTYPMQIGSKFAAPWAGRLTFPSRSIVTNDSLVLSPL
jgi:hypothetical protein